MALLLYDHVVDHRASASDSEINQIQSQPSTPSVMGTTSSLNKRGQEQERGREEEGIVKQTR